MNTGQHWDVPRCGCARALPRSQQPALARRMTIHCAGKEIEMSEVTAAALEAWLAERDA